MLSVPAEDYHVGIICALDSELAAVEAMLDEELGFLYQDGKDNNAYSLGRIHKHNVAIACLPAGRDGLAAAAIVAKDMIRTFAQIRFALLVGIGGGIPDLKRNHDIRLGDVVIGQPTQTSGGVVQYDKGKTKSVYEWEPKGSLNAPPTALLTALAQLKARHRRQDSFMSRYLKKMLQKYPKMGRSGYACPGPDRDVLYDATYQHEVDNMDCHKCSPDRQVVRSPRPTSDPEIHYGIIASGNQVIKSAQARDHLRQTCGALCVEMEAAGLMNDFPCLVIRGICDYADSHKNDVWHEYAAATAAAYAKELLFFVSAERTKQEKPAPELLGLLSKHMQETHQHYQNDRHRDCYRALKTTNYEEQKNIHRTREPETCQWVLNHARYQQWLSNRADLLWISADPGCGKSVLSRSLVDHDLQHACHPQEVTICYFFFNENDYRDSLSSALCSLLHQLFSQQRHLIEHAIPAFDRNGEKIRSETDELWRILLTATADESAKSVICVLDALDECKDNDRARLTTKLTEFYRSTHVSQNQAALKFLVTSRPYEDIETVFDRSHADLPSIRLHGEEHNDAIHEEIDIVVRSQVGQMARDYGLSSYTKDQIENKLLSMQHRTYLWLHLALDGIRTTCANSLRSDDVIIPNVPSTVDAAYQEILGRTASSVRETVKKIFLIIIGVRRPLTVGEMALALHLAITAHRPHSIVEFKISPQHLRRQIRQWCGLFVYLNHGKLYLFHQTAKEFLICNLEHEWTDNGLWKSYLRPSQIYVEMARIYMRFLCVDELETQSDADLTNHIKPKLAVNASWCSDGPSLQSYVVDILSFLDLSLEAWAQSWRFAQFRAGIALNEELTMLYDSNSNRFQRWVHARWWDYHDGHSALHYAALNGHSTVLRWLTMDSDPARETKSSDGLTTALLLAAKMGYEHVAQELVDMGAEVDAQNSAQETPLMIAAAKGFAAVVMVLVRANAKLDSGGAADSALVQAARNDQGTIVQILLHAQAQIHALPDDFYVVPLEEASRKGHLKIVGILLDARDKLNLGKDIGAALLLASKHGHRDIARLLLDTGADVNAQPLFHRDLERGRQRDHAELFYSSLLSPPLSNDARYSPLQLASHRGDCELISMLLSAGADINDQGSEDSSLYLAARAGQAGAVKLLLDVGADPNVRGSKGTALEAAIEYGRGLVVKLLLEKGANAKSIRHKVLGDLVYYYLTRTNYDIIQMLVQAGLDMSSQMKVHEPNRRSRGAIVNMMMLSEARPK